MAEAQFLDELTPEQQAAALEQLKTPSATPQAKPAGEDPLDALTPEEYLNLWVETKNDYLKPDVWAARNPERVNDPGVQAKLADIYALSRERGFKFSDVDLWEGAKGVGHAVIGMGKWAGQAARSALETPVTLLGQPEGPEKERLLMEQAKRAQELGASTESAVTGLGEMLRAGAAKVGKFIGKAASHLKRPEELKGPGSKGQPEPNLGGFFTAPLDETPEERQAKLRGMLARSQMQSQILKGEGAAMGTVTGDFAKILEKNGLPVDQERVAALAAGDPVTFLAFPGGFKLVTAGGKAIGQVATRTQAVQLINSLRVAQRAAAQAAKAEGAAARNLATQQAAFKAGGPIAAPGLAEAPDALRAAQAATTEARAGVTAAQEAVQGNLGARAIQAAEPVVEAISSGVNRAGQAIKGAAARATDIGVGTGIYGAGTAARTAGAVTDFVGSFLPPMATPRALRTAATTARGVGIGVQNTGKALMKANESAYSPRIRLISDMARTAPDVAQAAAKGFLLFDVPLAAATSETPSDTAHMPVFAATLGALSRVPAAGQRFVQSQLAKPFDSAISSNEPLRDYPGFTALNEATKQSVAAANDPAKTSWLSAIRQFIEPTGTQLHWVSDVPTLEGVLRRYAPGMEENWYKEAAQQRGVTLRVRGEDGQQHNVVIMRDVTAAPHESVHPLQRALGEPAMQKIRDLIWNEYAPVWDERGWNYVSQFLDSTKLKEYIDNGEGWQEALNDIASGNREWRNELTPEQINDRANTYLNDEISAEVMDNVLRNRGPELAERDNLLGRIARIVGKTMMGLGIEPFEGVRSEGQGTPVSMKGAEQISGAFREGLEGLKTEAGRAAVEAAPTFGRGRRTTSGEPVVSPRGETAPETETATPTAPTAAEAATEARDIAATSPDAPISGGTQPQKQIISDIADSIEGRHGLRLDYLSAPGEPAGSILSNRSARRSVIEAFRRMPESARVLFEKTFFPERVNRLRDGRLQVLGWAPEVFAANAFKLAETLSNAKRADLSPYPIDPKTKDFTDQGWRQLHEDLNTFVQNQTSGLTGAGEPLVVPKSVTDQGFRAPEVTGSGKSLSQDRADFINALFGIPVPRTPRIGNVFPRNLAGQRVSAATKPGRVTPTVEPRAPFTGEKAQRMGIEGETLKNVNPFIAELEAAGIKPSFIEALQRLNMDRIKGVEGAPESQNFRGNEFTLQAGFQPREGDLARYRELVDAMGSMKLEERFGQKGIATAKEIEEIKNRNGGNPPDKAPGLGEAQFQPKTEAGRKLEEKGYKLRWVLPENATEAKLVAFKGDRKAGYIRVDKNPEDMPEVYPPGSFDIGIVKTHPDFRKQGIADALYREALSVLRDSNVKDVTGFMIATTPLKTRERLMPGAQEYRTSPSLGSPKMSPAEALEHIDKRGGVEVRTRLNPEMQFQPSNEPGAIKAAAVRSEDGTIYEGPMHLAAYMKATKDGRDFMEERFDEGFVTNSGEFLNRTEAHQRATAMKQTTKENKFGLSSEDIVFQPSDKPKAIKAAAIRIKDTGEIFEGPMHGFAMSEVTTKYPDLGYKDVDEGFTTNSGEFLNREEAYLRARAQRQLSAEDAERATTMPMGNNGRLESVGFDEVRQFQPKPNSDVQKVADDYKAERGIDSAPFRPIAVKPETAKKIADFYENAKNDPENEAVQASYKALADETAEQYQMIVDAGYTLEPYKGKGEPYKNSDEMTADVRDNKHLYFLPTESALAKSDANNPMLADSGVNGWPVNDLFRAVHDFFGHAAEGLTFGPKGELNAWKVHSEMYSPEAQGALAAETLAQNSWVNFGKHLRDEAGNIPEKGQPGYRGLTERPFAEQKNIVIPKELIDEARGKVETEATFNPRLKPEDKPENPEDAGVRNYWVSPEGKFYYAGNHRDWAKARVTLDPKESRYVGIEESRLKSAGWVRMSRERENEFPAVFIDGHRLTDKQRAAFETWRELNSDVEIIDLTRSLKGDRQFQPRKRGEEKLPNAAGRTFKVTHYSSKAGLETIDPSFFGKGKATSTDLRGGKKSYFFVKGSDLGQDTNLFKDKGLREYEGSIDGADLYDLRKGKKDPLNWRSTINREEADSNVKAAGYAGIVLDTADGRQVVAMFKPTKVKQIGGNEYDKYNYQPRKLDVDTHKLLDLYQDNWNQWDTYLKKDNLTEAEIKNAEDAKAEVRVSIRRLEDELGVHPTQRFQFAPRKQEATLPGFEEGKKPLTTREIAEMTKPELRAHFPEAVVPKEHDKIVPSDITGSPLYKKSGGEAEAVEAFARRLVDFARQYEGSEQYKRGSEWYSDFTPRLQKEFGPDAEVMAELLAATSPNTNPEVNFGYAFDALKSFKDGRFDKVLPKFEEGLKKIEDGSWESWYAKEVKAGKVPDAPETPSPASFLAHWINKYDLKPKQSNGKLYGMHSIRVLQVLARKWMQMNAGPKTRNFVDNLLGRSDEATIDVWADRTMRWAGYEGFNDRWRILPENGTGVSDKDFAFSQKVFRRAAEQLGMKPSALQGALWFAEKQRWADNGWGRLDLGDFRTEMEKVPLLESGYRTRVKKTEADKRGKKITQTELVVEPRK